jgi:hypothetical protein
MLKGRESKMTNVNTSKQMKKEKDKKLNLNVCQAALASLSEEGADKDSKTTHQSSNGESSNSNNLD